ncbi:MAG: YeiH family protein [Aeromonas molluscorum]
MHHSATHSDQPSNRFAPLGQGQWWLGIALVALLAASGMGLAELPQARSLGLSALTIAIVIGILVGNTLFPRIAHHSALGVDFAKNQLLRAGIILYGFRITFQQIGDIGWSGVLIDMLIIGLTFTLALQLGTRLFKLDKQTSMLIGAGSAICGAAAVMAAEPVIKGQAHKASVAVATVVVFGTLAMFLYPLAYPYLGLSEAHYGIFAGSTIHEVAQVVAAGKGVSDEAAATAVIVKMMRVMMLAPFLLLLSAWLGRSQGSDAQQGGVTIPWFAVFFIVASGINSLDLLPPTLVDALIQLDTVLLAMAMAALGLRTHLGALRQAGIKPLLLAACLFLFLTVGGFFINKLVLMLFA